MPGPRKIARGVQDIRTHVGMSSEKKMPHQAYLRIACLEMEKFRRGQERQCAMRRVESIDSRCGEISEEQAMLMSSLGEAGLGQSRKAPAAPKAQEDQSGPVTTDTSGFKIRY